MAQESVDTLVAQAREALVARDREATAKALVALAPIYAQVSPVAAVDLLERGATFGTSETMGALYDAFPEFVYESWALALALRCANEQTARYLLEERCVDLLGSVHQPTTYRALLPHEGTFTRFDLTRQSPTLFLNPMDPTVSTEVFEPFRGRANEHLAGSTYRMTTSLSATCDLVAQLASEGWFDAVVFDDLLRAALVRAWHALRHEGEHDEETAEICLAFSTRMLEMHYMRGQGDQTVRKILGSLIVPKASPRIIAFVCDEAPDVFLERLCALKWLQHDDALVARMVSHLSPSTEEHNGRLLLVLAEGNHMAELSMLQDWENTFTTRNVDAAMDAASRAGHAEAAAWLLARRPQIGTTGTGQASTGDLADLLL